MPYHHMSVYSSFHSFHVPLPYNVMSVDICSTIVQVLSVVVLTLNKVLCRQQDKLFSPLATFGSTPHRGVSRLWVHARSRWGSRATARWGYVVYKVWLSLHSTSLHSQFCRKQVEVWRYYFASHPPSPLPPPRILASWRGDNVTNILVFSYFPNHKKR